jgi:hypothetical protein
VPLVRVYDSIVKRHIFFYHCAICCNAELQRRFAKKIAQIVLFGVCHDASCIFPINSCAYCCKRYAAPFAVLVCCEHVAEHVSFAGIL